MRRGKGLEQDLALVKPGSTIVVSLHIPTNTGAARRAKKEEELGGTEILFRALTRAAIDVYPEYTGTLYEEILRDRFVLLSSSRWHERVASQMYLDDIVDLPLISMTDASTAMRYMAAAYLQRGIEFRPKMQFDQVGTIAGFVKQGLGIAVLPYLGMTPLLTLRGLRVSAIVDGPVRSVGIVTRRAGTPTAIAEQAMQEVRTVASALIQRQSEWVLPPAGRVVARRSAPHAKASGPLRG